MLSLLLIILTLLIKVIFYMFLLIMTLAIATRLWIEPVKGVCKCDVNLKGRVALITGGNNGIGLETARALAQRGARVIIASRDAAKSQNAVEDIIKTTGNKTVEYRHLDLSKFSNVRQFAKDFNRSVNRLDILVNNAGAAGIKQCLTIDGIDLVMQVNYLSAFLLTNLLLDKLIASKPSRIVIVTSYAHKSANFDANDLAGVKSKGYWTKYTNSKLCQVLWTKALSRHLPTGVTVNCLHPGIVRTDIWNKIPYYLRKILLNIIEIVFKTPIEGAQTSLHLCVAPNLEQATGGYYADCSLSQESTVALDEQLAERVWNDSVMLTNK